jgi:hypothetical protein
MLIGGIAVLAALAAGRGVTPVISPAGGAAAALAIANVSAEIHQADHTIVTAADVPAATMLHINTHVEGGGAAPTGMVRFRTYDTGGCAEPASGEQVAGLTGGSTVVRHSADFSSAGGWDSATIWTSQAGDGFGTDWFGSVFMGTDPPFFSHSGAGWRFAGVSLSATDTIDSAYLLLRINRSRPNLASENFGTWKTAIRIDSRSGAGFASLDHAGFIARFNAGGVPWQIPFSFAQPDPFGTQQGAPYARSPDITALVAARIGSPSWSGAGDVVLGILDDMSAPTAEAQVVDAPDNVRLHIDWTTWEPFGAAESAPFAAAAARSYRVQYDGDSQYAATDGLCVSVIVTPPDSDGDGYSDAAEAALAKDPFVYCDVMRADIDGDGSVSILDLSQVAQWFGQNAPPAPRRFNQDGDTAISILDLARMAQYFLSHVSACP